MNTDSEGIDLTRGKSTSLLLRVETEQIIGCVFHVLNEVGHGFHEKIYENSLAAAFKLKGIAFDQQRRFPVLFKGEQVGEFIPDFLVFEAVVTDPKVIDQVTDYERGQMLNYLRITKKRVGLILNFKHARLQWERVVL
jgi:GxxExxY protein